MKPDHNYEVNNLLHALGVSPKYLGRKYLAEAVLMSIEKGGLNLNLSKVYPIIAEKFDTTAYAVERNIRTGATKMWELGNRDLLEKVLGHELRSKPTNSELVSGIAKYILRVSESGK